MKIFVGRVVKTEPKTVTVEVSRVVTHPLYSKQLKRNRKYQVHDEIGVKVGDIVKFAGSKPYSKMKKWKIIEERKGKNK